MTQFEVLQLPQDILNPKLSPPETQGNRGKQICFNSSHSYCPQINWLRSNLQTSMILR